MPLYAIHLTLLLIIDRTLKNYPTMGALDLIEEKKGVDFDPVLVDIFRENLTDMIQIVNAYSD